jgi:hypothetical protein
MNMRSLLILLVPALVAGCATQRPVALQTSAPVAVAAISPTKIVETRYDVRGYRDANDPSVRHEDHAVYRRTRVPDNATTDYETVPSEVAPASISPLPASEELKAELATQKKITADLRTMQASMAETERRMQAQYAQLVRESGDAMKLRAELEGKRDHSQAAGTSTPVATTTANGSEAKW